MLMSHASQMLSPELEYLACSLKAGTHPQTDALARSDGSLSGYCGKSGSCRRTKAKSFDINIRPEATHLFPLLSKNLFGSPHITKDGVSVAKEIELENNFENMGAQMVKEVAQKTN